tara:strand:- start:34584 stop:34724 length:141 start_codon:yes stop_codon:yes gene_type:complete
MTLGQPTLSVEVYFNIGKPVPIPDSAIKQENINASYGSTRKNYIPN